MPRRIAELRALGAAVRQVRLQAGLSLEELGDRSGLHRTYVAGIERGERNPTWSNVVTLAEGLEVKLSALAELAERCGA